MLQMEVYSKRFNKINELINNILFFGRSEHHAMHPLIKGKNGNASQNVTYG
jgi:hypothetical protein